MEIERSTVSGSVYIRVRGRLDGEKVDRIEAWLGTSDPEEHVVIDFHETRSFDAAALARLARELSQSDRRVALHGLGEHHYRLLRYVGTAPLQ